MNQRALRIYAFIWANIGGMLGFVAGAFFVMLLLMLHGCAQTPYWVKVAEPASTIRVTVVDVFMPDPRHGYGVKGMAVRNKDGSCDIYALRVHLSQCVVNHEKMHCAGYDHPDYEFLDVCRDLIPYWFTMSASGGNGAAQAWGGPSLLATPMYPWDRSERPLTEKEVGEKLGK